MIRKQVVSGLFDSLVNKRVSILYNERMYPVKKRLEENWVYYAFSGFKVLNAELERRGRPVESFAAIGSGNGVDALGAHFVFKKAKRFFITDIDSEVIGLALNNFHNNCERRTGLEVTALSGNLTAPLVEKEVECDLVYANLPNIPLWSESQKKGFGLSTFYNPGAVDRVPSKIGDYLLGLQYRFLRSAPASLSKKGSVVQLIGGRFPVKIFDALFKRTEFELESLCLGFKPQTEAKEVLEGYSRAEKQNGVEFIFYDYARGLKRLRALGESNLVVGKKMFFLEKELGDFAFTATQALKEFKGGKRIGHSCHVLRGKYLS
ncbi:MAG: hypothetical protein V1494_05440 [Candidatus Diapherotrites archaeon]